MKIKKLAHVAIWVFIVWTAMDVAGWYSGMQPPLQTWGDRILRTDIYSLMATYCVWRH